MVVARAIKGKDPSRKNIDKQSSYAYATNNENGIVNTTHLVAFFTRKDTSHKAIPEHAYTGQDGIIDIGSKYDKRM